MKSNDVMETLDIALGKTGDDKVYIKQIPELPSDNGHCYLSKELRNYLDEKGVEHIPEVLCSILRLKER